MGLIENANGKPMQDDAPPVNGGTEPRKLDIRTLRTGTLIYNLGITGAKELGAVAMCERLEMAKIEQKLVSDPPQLVAMRHELGSLEQSRFIMASELNARFNDFDMMIAKSRGLEIHEPDAPATEDAIDPKVPVE